MKKLWSMLRERIHRDNRGMTFVEVLCAIAILTLVTGVIGTVVVISTRTYRRGISETEIQQEAQLAANNIGNLVKDACSVRYAAAGAQYLENGETLMVKSDGVTPVTNETGFTDLSIITNEKVQYTITYDDTKSVLRYAEFDEGVDSPRRPVEIMANNVTAFSADTTDFKKSKTIKMNMTVRDVSTNREIPMEYTMTSRNDAKDGFEYVASSLSVVLAFPDAEVVLVPGETYQIPLLVSGTLSEGLEWEDTGALTGGALTTDYAEVTVPKNIDPSVTSETIKVRTKDKNADGTYKSMASCTVLIRRVTKVEVTHTVDTAHADGHMLEAAGAEYTFSATVAGNELPQRPAYGFDNNYKRAQAVVWSCVFDLNGTQTAYDWTVSQDPVSGQWTFAQPDFETSPFSDYFEVLENKENEVFPSFKIKLIKAMPAKLKLTVRATSKHALGVNKANSDYGDKDNTFYYGEDTIEPRETKMNQGLTITLEPYESGKVAVGMKGGISSNVTFDFHDASDEGSGKTRAEYIASEDKVEITLGKDEMGSGPNPTGGLEPYTFTVDVKADGEVKTTIKVYVCRIDTISVAVIDNYHEKKNDGKPDDHATYDFRARFNTDTASLEDMQAVTKNLIRYKEDGTPDEDALKKTLSSKITWELIDHSAYGEVVHTDYVVCEAGVGKKGNIITNYKKGEFKSLDGKAVFKIVDVKPARIEKDADGNWIIKQLPEVDIAPSTMPKDYELKVTIRSLHPSGNVDGGTYNQTGMAYIDTNVEASASVTGNMSVSAPADLVIVEPGQGINDEKQSDIEMVIPLKVTASAYKMTATLSEKSENGTQLCSYKSGNPYKAENASSANEGKYTWYLGLNIDAKEKGNNLGRIKVHVDAFDTKDNVVASTDFELGVRRVDEIDVKVEKNQKISTVNKADKLITLEALPNGCDIKTTEFYAIQKDESGRVCRWEQNGHGGYKDPYVMEWRMEIGGKEQPLGDWKEYVKKVTADKTVPDEKKAVISFELKKSLPVGTKIRAYSLHARGNNGEDEGATGYVKYNKSGKEYGKVYGELIIGDELIVADGFKRGKDYEFIKDIVNVRADVFEWGNYLEQGSFYRYKELDAGAWSKYHMMDSGATTSAWANYVPMSYLFRPDKEYAIEVVSVLYNKTDKLIYWPLDEELLEPGRGWAEAGFKLWKPTQEQWKRDIPTASEYWWSYAKYEECYDKVQKIPEVKQTFKIPKSEMYFNARADAPANTLTVNGKVTSAGSESEPIRLNGDNGNTSDYSGFIVDLEITGYEMNTDQQCFRTIVQKKSGNQWITLGYDDESVIHDKEGFSVDSANPYISIYRTGNAQGLYRVVPVILAGEKTNHKIQWRDVTDTPRSGYTDMDVLFNPEYTTSEENYHLYDYNTGKYVIYFEFYR